VKTIFTRHPNSAGQTYWQHFLFAGLNGLRLVYAGLACIVHSIFPFVFMDTASQVVQNISEQMAARKHLAEQNKK
jgi:hypothetical protein